MKKLLLASSSKFITDKGLNLFDRPLNKIKIGYIITASKKVDDLSYIAAERKRFKELGFDCEEIDIKGKSEDELREILKDKQAVYVTGGNTFHLLKCARASGFEKIIRELLGKGVIYIGASAGSYLACPTIAMATWKGNKGGKANDRCGLEDFIGMNLVGFLIFAHYTPEYEEMINSKIKKLDYDIKTLTDDQAVLVKGDKIEVLNN